LVSALFGPSVLHSGLGLHLVRRPAPWRLIELECGQPVYVCPVCSPALRRVLLLARESATQPRWLSFASPGVADAGRDVPIREMRASASRRCPLVVVRW